MVEPTSEAARVVGERIRMRRQALAINQECLARLASIHATNLGKIERGRANPSLHTMLRIAGALEMEPAELLVGLTSAELPDGLVSSV
jgi:transcriptional regulator with XRE-family HTH domain